MKTNKHKTNLKSRKAGAKTDLKKEMQRGRVEGNEEC
jgi:hypothetical protein